MTESNADGRLVRSSRIPSGEAIVDVAVVEVDGRVRVAAGEERRGVGLWDPVG
ncbi:hypothetical protein [Streptomyces sedi]|uniref:hypothetical protein n=1 Tax=Streptomyces sedi TaxID=555059 RepID=UPI0014772C87|nr:hypothetical protein [Streptomyces sedi]